jgi:nucleoside-diphosphate-sugar epimerase
MSKGVCAVTGATGFLGRHIADKMRTSGLSVIKLQRKKDAGDGSNEETIYFALGQKIDAQALAHVDVLIHCAYDFSCTSWDEINEINIKGTRLLFESAKKANVGPIIFISSMHAFEGCRTLYGKAKLAGEKCALDYGGIVIRPGTSYLEENGKLFGGLGGKTLQSFEKLFRITPVIPILYSNKSVIYTSHVHDLCALIEESISKHSVLVKPICGVNEKPLTLKQFLVKIKDRQIKRKVLFIPVPWQIPWLFLSLLETCRIKLPFQSDSILTFFDQNPDPDFSSFKLLKTRFRAF